MSSSVEKRHQTIGEEGRPSGRNFVIPIAVGRAETPFETGFAAFAILLSSLRDLDLSVRIPPAMARRCCISAGVWATGKAKAST
jgi:hypothetical protein